MSSAWADELAFATDLARRAGGILTASYERLDRIDYKSKRDVVTNADYASERLVIDAIKDRYPGDAILAEESGEHAGVLRDDGSHNGRTWVIDPLDGTVNYANGIPIFCVSIGLAVGGRPVVGVVYDPVRDEMFTAQAGRGAQLDGVPIRHPAKEKLSDLVISLALPASGWSDRERRVRKRIRVARVLGSAALALAYVGNGRFDGFVQAGGLSLWDICAAGLIASEGGATITTRKGGDWFDITGKSRSIGLVAAAPRHHSSLMELLA
jgi:myo-inositol-1(or 4)-monophosphatase